MKGLEANMAESAMNGEGAAKQLGTWPVRLIVGGSKGYSLWTSDDAEFDRVLVHRESIVLFESTAQLTLFLTSGLDSNLDTHAGYRALKQDAQLRAQVMATPPREFDIDRAASALADQAKTPTLPELEAILDAIWMIKDIAASLSDRFIFDALETDASIAALIELLTAAVTVIGEGSPVYYRPALAWREVPDRARVALLGPISSIGARIVQPPTADASAPI